MTTGTTIDLFGLADANKDWLESEYQLIKKNSDEKKSALLEDLCTRVKNEWHLSINLNDLKLSGVLDSEKYLNIYELKDSQAKQLIKVGILDDSIAKGMIEISIKKYLNIYSEKRRVFDSSILNGHKTKYTALNIGGIGTTKYGDFCIILKKEKAEKYKNLAFIKEDSAENYVAKDCLLRNKLTHDVANRECVDLLAVVKHENQIEEVSSDRWDRMVCEESIYIEAVTTDDIILSHIKCVRIDKTCFKEIYTDLLMKNFNSELNKDEWYRLDVVKKILKELKDRGIALEKINDN